MGWFKNPPLKCLKCGKVVIKLVSVIDDGKGEKVCQKCKKEIKKTKESLSHG